MQAVASNLHTKGQILTDEEIKKSISKVARPDDQLTLAPLLTPPKRVLLIVPPGTMEESYGRLSAAAGELPMLGLAYVAASLRDQGHDVKIIDYEVNAWSLKRVRPDIEDWRPDVVGMTAYITNLRRCGAVAKIVKEVDPGITVILGGPQVSVFPEEGFTSPHVDIIALSEGEVIIRNVMNALGDVEKLKKVKGIWFRHGSEIIQNERESLVDNLDMLPPPALDLYEMHKYFPASHVRGRKVAHLLTSRGCPFKCTFCETKLTFGRSFRYHSKERVIEDMMSLVKQGYNSFQFYDDIFTVNKKRVEELCHAIIDSGFKVQWMCWTRTNCVSPDLLALMKKAGCYLITFGAESGNEESLKLIKKNLGVEKNFEGIKMTHDAGIRTMSSFMLGLPGETPEMTQKTIQFALDSLLDYAIFPITEPYPGTEMWVDAQKYGTFDTSGKFKNNLLSENSAVWVPHGRNREELEKFAASAMRQFYFRPRIIWRSFLNLLLMPPGRAFRFVFGGLKFFMVSLFQKAHAGARY
ncbi:MAG: cobalamin-dependent protein [Leptospirales bacterium]|nr:cobalamin-dependent protein [Leptospirales bacterium]